MLLEDQHPLNKSIMVAVLGEPNVGKSSLVNYLMGMDLSVVTHLPQTTRNKFHCIFNIDHTEIILVDTPGMHKSNVEINKRMNEQAREGTDGADLNLILIDLTREIMRQFSEIQELLRRDLAKTWVVFTKSDRIENPDKLPLDEVFAAAKNIIPSLERYFVVSSKEGKNMHLLTGAICDAARPGPHHYMDGRVSNKSERFFATEYIREQAFRLLKEELPYEVAVLLEEFKELEPNVNVKEPILANIKASILVNRASQRAIVVGSKGSMIKEIGIHSRKRIEELLGGRVILNLHVKVSPRWDKNNFVLEEIGLPRATDSNRVWRGV